MVKNFSKPYFQNYLKKKNQLDFLNIIKKDRNDLQKIVEKNIPKYQINNLFIKAREVVFFQE